MKKIILLLATSCFICACSPANNPVSTVETLKETVTETQDKWEAYRESLELTMWTFHGQVMTAGDVPVVLANENAAVMQFSVDAFNYDPSFFVYIYINDELVEKRQFSNVSTSIDITEKYLQEGEYEIRLVYVFRLEI